MGKAGKAPAKGSAQVTVDKIDNLAKKTEKVSAASEQVEVPGSMPEAIPEGKVKVSLGHTMNTGNYTSVRCEVGIELPAPLPEIDEVYEFALQWVDSRLGTLITETKANFGVE